MNGFYTVLRAAFILVILSVLLIPSPALATSENVPYASVDASFSKQISVPEKTTRIANAFSEGVNSKEDLENKGVWSSFFKVLIGLAVLTTSIVAGTVFAYANSVMPGLRKSDDRTFVLSIRHLTSSVANPIFLIISNGALLTQIGFFVLAVFLQQFEKFVIGSIALIFYVATLLITFLGNLPLNKEIISAELPESDSGWHELRVRFESRWTLLNHLRTLTCILSASALVVALLI
ncbi:anthrone oxygenase family protein [Sporosarcina sp. CAU 1771]